jgi:hypothetical protein
MHPNVNCFVFVGSEGNDNTIICGWLQKIAPGVVSEIFVQNSEERGRKNEW